MKRARFRDPAGTVRTGEWDDGTIAAAGREYDADRVSIEREGVGRLEHDVEAPAPPDRRHRPAPPGGPGSAAFRNHPL